MTHLDEGTIQAFLDDELAPGERATAAEHLMACAECRRAHDGLDRAHALFTEAIGELDVRPAATPAWDRVTGVRRKPLAAAPFVRAAILVLMIAAAASAAVPGSPVRALIVAVVQDDGPVAEAPVDLAPVDVRSAPAAPPAPAGVSMVAGRGRLVVEVASMEGVAIRLKRGTSESVAVSAAGGKRDPAFRTGAGRIEVHGGVGGELLVEVPVSAAVRLIVDGRVYAESADGDLDVHVPGETVDGGVVWR